MKPYEALQREIKLQDLERSDIATKLKKSLSYVNTRMALRAGWTLEDAYTILDVLSIPHDQLHIYFPPAGFAKNLSDGPEFRKQRTSPTSIQAVVLLGDAATVQAIQHAIAR